MSRIFYLSILLALTLSLNTSISAKEVDINTAKTVAKNFFYERSSLLTKVDYNSINISESTTISSKSNNVYYIFNFRDNGFVLVSADDNVYPIIAYSLENKFINDNQPDNLKYWMEQYKKQITNVINSKIVANNKINEQWQHYLTKPNVSENNNKSVVIGPLLPSTWDQGMYYNSSCPPDSTGPAGHAYTGCIATAMAQVMYYYRYPLTGIGIHSDSVPYYHITYTVNCGATNYDWNGMSDALTMMNPAVATLIYHAGVAVGMQYKPTGSAAWSPSIPSTLSDHFGYQTVTMNYRYNFNDSNWIVLLKTDLDAKRPIIYSGADTSQGGHTFVCDGYDSFNKFHMNWGWSGSSNGYYMINNLNPSGFHFDSCQLGFTNIYPGSGYPYNCTGTTNITTARGTIEDGSGPSNYQNNNDCRWLISPPNATSVHFTFKSISTESSNDNIIIYDGATTSDSILGTFSGSNIPSSINSTGGQMLIRFVTNQSTTFSGWRATYYATVQPMCSSTTNLTAPSGTFSDGSGTNPYEYSLNCHWKICPPGATSITLGFNSFDLSTFDKVKIIDAGHTPNVSLDTYTGTTLPATKTYNTGQIIIWFLTTSYTNGQGWDAFYSSSPVNINGNTLSNDIIIYPNPAKSNFTIKINENNAVLKIYSTVGQLMKEDKLTQNENTIDIKELSTGSYILEVISEKNIYHYKIIKE